MPISKWLVYGLRDPRNGEIRYVGKSSSGLRRSRAHQIPAYLKQEPNSHKANWIRKLNALGLEPEPVVLQQLGSPVGLCDAERQWIAIGRAALGKRLTNATSGGEHGFVRTPRSVERVAARIRSYWASPKGREFFAQHGPKLRAAARSPTATPHPRRRS